MPRDGGGVGEESVFHGHRISALQDQKVLETDGGDGITPNIFNPDELYVCRC